VLEAVRSLTATTCAPTAPLLPAAGAARESLPTVLRCLLDVTLLPGCALGASMRPSASCAAAAVRLCCAASRMLQCKIRLSQESARTIISNGCSHAPLQVIRRCWQDGIRHSAGCHKTGTWCSATLTRCIRCCPAVGRCRAAIALWHCVQRHLHRPADRAQLPQSVHMTPGRCRAWSPRQRGTSSTQMCTVAACLEQHARTGGASRFSSCMEGRVSVPVRNQRLGSTYVPLIKSRKARWRPCCLRFEACTIKRPGWCRCLRPCLLCVGS
jgi:hypothetical protein